MMRLWLSILTVTVMLLVGQSSALALSTSRSHNSIAYTQVGFGTFATTPALHQIGVQAKTSWPYYVSRAAGLVASGLLLLLIISGIGLIVGYTYRIMEPLTAWKVHRALGISFGVCVAIHVGSLLFDTFDPFTIFQLFVPFLYHYPAKNGVHDGTFYMGLGVIAMYCAAIIIITSLVWRERKPATWRLLHYLSYLLVILVFMHALFLGADLSHGTLRYVWIVGGFVVIIGIISRLTRSRTINKP
jgi:sulfoxide reductase heme-binding subunit YedZ